MSNQTIIDDLTRIKFAVLKRAPSWDPLQKNLKEAEADCLTHVSTLCKKLGGSIYLANPLVLDTDSSYVFSNTQINGTFAGLFMGDTPVRSCTASLGSRRYSWPLTGAERRHTVWSNRNSSCLAGPRTSTKWVRQVAPRWPSARNSIG